MRLNKKQQIVGWAAVLLISAVILRTVMILPSNTYLDSVKIFLSLYFIIFIFGLLLIYVLGDKKK